MTGKTKQHKTPRQRASVMVVVVVVIVLMTVIGTVYLQVAQTQRSVAVKQTDNIDTVLAHVVQQIQIALTRDIFDDQDRQFGEHTSVVTGYEVLGDVEPYDFPWTNYNSADVTIPGIPLDLTTRAKFGNGDDAWLAFNAPDFSGPTPQWIQITTLTGAFYDTNTTSVSSDPTNREVKNIVEDADADVIRNGVGNDFNANLDITDPNLVDADGDGIGDARWERVPPPFAQMNSRQYFMAVRIIDLSAYLNANVALAQTDNTGAYTTVPGGEPTGWNPSELDLARHAFAYGNSATFVDEVESLIEYRLGSTTAGSPGIPTPFFNNLTGLARLNFWQGGAARFNNFTAPYQQLGASEELFLRYRGGVQPGGTLTYGSDTELATYLPSMLAPSPIPAPTDTTAMQDIFENKPANQLTTLSGIGIFAPPIASTGSNPAGLERKFALNDPRFASATHADVVAALTELSDAIEAVYSIGSPSFPPNVSSAAEFADQFAVNIQDYRDADNILTELNGRYGWEALPIISEVYAYREYTCTSTSAAGVITNTWDASAAPPTGFAIEIINPNATPAQLTGVSIDIDGTSLGSLPAIVDNVSSTTLAASVATFNNTKYGLTNDERLYPGDRIIIYQNASGTDILDQINNPTDYILIERTGIAWPEGTTSTHDPISINLSATAILSDSTTTTIRYHAGPSVTFPESYVDSNTVADYGGLTGNYELAKLGSVTGMFGITLNTSRFSETRLLPGDNAALDDDVDELGETAKSAPFASFDLTKNQIIIGDYNSTDWPEVGDNQLQYAGEVANILILGPTASTTIAEEWGNSPLTRPDEFRLNFSSAQVIDASAYNLNIPHAALLMDRLTNLSPQSITGGQFIPGTININTASETLLANALPFADQNVRDYVSDRIITLRDAPNRDDSFPQPVKGIASTWELWQDLSIILTGQSATFPDYIGDTSGFDPSGTNTLFDYSPYPAIPTDGIADDREEETLLLSWLQQMTSTRSDVFAAFILVKGYDTDDQDRPLTDAVQESGRLIVIFSRAEMTANESASVNILATYRY